MHSSLLSQAYENPDSDQRSQLKTDCQLRKEFGITSDVQICLQRPKPTVKPDQLTERLIINKRTLDGLRKVIQESKLQSKIQQMMQASYIFMHPNCVVMYSACTYLIHQCLLGMARFAEKNRTERFSTHALGPRINLNLTTHV